jgi:hypothetical protein
MLKKIYISLCILLFASCASSKYKLSDEIALERLSICVNYLGYTDALMQKEIDERLEKIISQYNTQNHLFKLDLCQNRTKSALIININETSMVEKSNQIAGVLISLAGIATTTTLLANGSPIIFWFGYFPRNNSNVDIALTKDLLVNPKSYNKNFSNSGFLISKEAQIFNHGLAFKHFLIKELKKIEKQVKKKNKHRR